MQPASGYKKPAIQAGRLLGFYHRDTGHKRLIAAV